MKRKLLTTILALTVLLAQPLTTFAATKHLWNLQNADIRAVIDAIAKQTNKNFVIDPRVQGKISIVSTAPIGSKAAYQLFLSALRVLGYSAIPGKSATKIVPNIDARTMNTPIVDASNPGAGDELVARVVPVHYVSALQLVPVLRPMMSQWSNIAAYSPSNVVILAGHAANVSRIAAIINQVDRPESSEVEVIPLKRAIASKVVNTLQSLQNSERSIGKISNISLAADNESNKILMTGSRAERLKFRVLISQLDTAGSYGGNTKVLHLNYIDAKKLEPVLTAIANAANAGTTGQSNGRGAASQVAVKADVDANSIIITAPPQIMQTIVNVVHNLDTRPTQVLVEAIIAEVDENKLKQIGVSWGTGVSSSSNNGDDNGGGGGGQNTPTIAMPDMGLLKGIIKNTNITALVTALQHNTASNILSTPSVVVADNQKADIAVGKEIGVLNRTYSTNNQDEDGTSTPYNTYQRKKIPLSLKVTPQISPDNSIRLKITQENDSLENPANPGDNPIINTNKIDTTVLVHNGDVLVLGGLISNQVSKGLSKVPILGDLPLIGTLFRYHNNTTEKKDLMVFIKPIILRRGVNAERITGANYNKIRNVQILKNQGVDLITNMEEQPVLKPLVKPKIALPAPFSQ